MASQSLCCVQQMKVIVIFLFHSAVFKVELGMVGKKERKFATAASCGLTAGVSANLYFEHTV